MGGKGSKQKKQNQEQEEEAEGKLMHVVMLGMGGVGKSALVIQFVQDKFIKVYDPTIEDSYRKQVVVDNKVCMLNIWDTAGQEEFEALQDGYIRQADGFVLVYSITDRKTFEKIESLFIKILRVKCSDGEPVVIVGNKSDLEDSREVSSLEEQQLASKLQCEFMETSAATKSNVENAYATVVRSIRAARTKTKPKGKKK